MIKQVTSNKITITINTVTVTVTHITGKSQAAVQLLELHLPQRQKWSNGLKVTAQKSTDKSASANCVLEHCYSCITTLSLSPHLKVVTSPKERNNRKKRSEKKRTQRLLFATNSSLDANRNEHFFFFQETNTQPKLSCTNPVQ